MRIQRIGILVLLLISFQSMIFAQTADFNPIGCNTIQTDIELAGSDVGYILVLSGSTIDFNPVDGTSYTINSIYGAGADVSPLGDGEYIVYDGIGNSIVTSIPNNTSLFYEVFPYLIAGGNKIYSLSTSFSGIMDPITALDVDFTISNPTCSSNNEGSLLVDILSGQGDYSWTLDGVINLIPTTCQGDSDGYVEFFVNTAGLSGSVATVAFISPTGITTSAGGDYELSGLSAGTYDIIYFSAPDSSCSDTLSFTILDGAFSADAAVSPESCNGAGDGSIRLTNLAGGTGPYTISWADTSGVALGTGTDITGAAGVYVATISDANMCDYTQVYTIGLDGTNCAGCASAINAADLYDIFSPNNDGMNDIWEVNGLASCTSNKLIICNRWGDKVFEGDNVTNTAWDGTGSNGDELPTGAYYYFLELDDDTDPDNILRGVVNLVR